MLRAAVAARKLTLHELQVLVGHPNFACHVIAPSRAFLRCLCDAMARVKWPTHRIRVTTPICEDLQLWLSFLKQFNGISFWRDIQLLKAGMQVSSDAAGSLDFGLDFRGCWCVAQWPESWKEVGITRDLTFL